MNKILKQQLQEYEDSDSSSESDQENVTKSYNKH